MFRPINIIILTSGDGRENELLGLLSDDRRVRIISHSSQLDRVYSEVVRWRPSAVIVSLDAGPENAWALCQQINRVCPETVIICASRGNSPDLIIESLRSGSREFLRLPVSPAELRTVIDRVAELTVGVKHVTKKPGRVIAVFSNKGGCGTSFIAANLAVGLGSPTALVDLNLQSGSLDLFFGIKQKFSIVDLVKNRARIDDRLLSGYLVQISEALVLLPAPYDAEAAEDITPENIVEIIDILRERYDFLVLDLPHLFDAITIGAMDQSDEFLLVTTLDILAVRATQRALVIMRRLGYPREKIRLVVNRWNKQSDLEIQHLERYLGERITVAIPDDYRSVTNSINRGSPLVNSKSSTPIIGELKKLAGICGAVSTPAQSNTGRNLLNTIFRRRSDSGTAELQGVIDEKPTLADKKE